MTSGQVIIREAVDGISGAARGLVFNDDPRTFSRIEHLPDLLVGTLTFCFGAVQRSREVVVGDRLQGVQGLLGKMGVGNFYRDDI